MSEIAKNKGSEIDELKLVGAFIKDQKISALPKRKDVDKSIRSAALDNAKLPFIKDIKKEA